MKKLSLQNHIEICQIDHGILFDRINALEKKTAAISAVPIPQKTSYDIEVDRWGRAVTLWDIHREDVMRVGIAFAFAVAGFVMGRWV